MLYLMKDIAPRRGVGVGYPNVGGLGTPNPNLWVVGRVTGSRSWRVRFRPRTAEGCSPEGPPLIGSGAP
jgi:hypothetical protein